MSADVRARGFRDVMARYPTGVAVVTCLHERAPVGLVVGSLFAASLDPELVGFCVGNESVSWPKVRAAGSFGVNVLAGDQAGYAAALGVSGPHKFDSIPWRPSPNGVPVIDGVILFLECTLDLTVPAGDHTIAVCRVHARRLLRDDGPLVFHGRRYSTVAGAAPADA